MEKNYVKIDRNYTKKEVEAILAKYEISAESVVYKTGAGTPAYVSGAYLNHFINIFESPVIISKSIQEQANERLAEIAMDAWRQYGQDRGKSLDDVASVINCQFQLSADELLELTDEEIQAEIDRMYTNDESEDDDDYSDEAYARVDAELEELKKECPDSFKGDWEKEDNDETDDETNIDWDDFQEWLTGMAIGSSDKNSSSDEESDKKFFSRLADECGNKIMTNELALWYNGGNYKGEGNNS